MIEGLVLRSDAATANAITAFAKCLASPGSLAKINTAFGEDMFGEWLIDESRRRSLCCEDLRKKQLPHDFVINGHRVQAKCGAGRRGMLDCRPVSPYVNNNGVRRYPASKIDVMAVCLLSSFEVFFIPTASFLCPKHDGMIRRSFSRDKCLQWKDAWGVLDGTSGPHPVQLLLF